MQVTTKVIAGCSAASPPVGLLEQRTNGAIDLPHYESGEKDSRAKLRHNYLCLDAAMNQVHSGYPFSETLISASTGTRDSSFSWQRQHKSDVSVIVSVMYKHQ